MWTRTLVAPGSVLAAVILLFAPQSLRAEQSVRIATYNIKFLSVRPGTL